MVPMLRLSQELQNLWVRRCEICSLDGSEFVGHHLSRAFETEIINSTSFNIPPPVPSASSESSQRRVYSGPVEPPLAPEGPESAAASTGLYLDRSIAYQKYMQLSLVPIMESPFKRGYKCVSTMNVNNQGISICEQRELP